MQQQNVHVGFVYAIKVGKTIRPVLVKRVVESKRPGKRTEYEGKNLKTGRMVRFSAAKCRYQLVKVQGTRNGGTDWVPTSAGGASEHPDPQVRPRDPAWDVALRWMALRYALITAVILLWACGVLRADPEPPACSTDSECADWGVVTNPDGPDYAAPWREES